MTTTMTTSTTDRRRGPRGVARAAALAVTALVAGSLSAVVAAPAQAAEGCTSEVPPNSGPPLYLQTDAGCDDTTPPETTVGAVTPTPNEQGWIRQGSVTIAFAGHHTDADSDPIEYECQLYTGATAPTQWSACESPVTYDDLADTPEGGHTFRVRAIDAADDDIDLTADFFFPSETDQADVDQTPASTVVRVDTVAPVAIVTGGPYDSEGTGWPVSPKPSVKYRLDASEPHTSYKCELDGRPVTCAEGEVKLRKVEGGPHTFTVRAVDRAGNESRDLKTERFIMPYDLERKRGWKEVKGKGWFGRDVIQSGKRGAQLTTQARNVRRMVLVAPSDPSLGKIRVKVGKGMWRTVRLDKGKPAKQKHYLVRPAGAPLVSGTVVIEVVKGTAQVDAVYFPG